MVFCAENWVPGSSSQVDEADLFEWVEVESYEPEPLYTVIHNTLHTFDLAGEARRRGWCEHELMYQCTTLLSLVYQRGCVAWRRT